MEKRRVVVTGLGSINAIGHNVEETWKSIQNGVCGINEITNYDKELTKVKIAGEVKDFNPADYLDKKAVRKMHHLPFAVAPRAELTGRLHTKWSDAGILVRVFCLYSPTHFLSSSRESSGNKDKARRPSSQPKPGLQTMDNDVGRIPTE